MFLVFPSEDAWSLEDTLIKLTSRFHKKVLLDMYVWTDDRDSSRHIIYVSPAQGPCDSTAQGPCDSTGSL